MSRTNTNIDNIVSGLGENKVNVDIKKNRMNEMDVFKPGGEFMNAFANFENIFGNFKNRKGGSQDQTTYNVNYNTPTGTTTRNCTTGDLSATLASIPAIANSPGLADTINNAVNQALALAMKHNGQGGGNYTYNYTTSANGEPQLVEVPNYQNRERREPSQKMKETMERHRLQREQRIRERSEKVLDPPLYIIAAYIDKTLSLFSKEEINKKVGEFRSTLDKNLTNHVDAYKEFKFKSQKISVEDVQCSLRRDRDSLYPLVYYASHLLKSNVIMVESSAKKTHSVEYDKESDKYIFMTDELLNNEPQEAEERDGFRSYSENAFKDRIKNIDVKGLKKMLVKDLKALATDLKIDLIKTVETKNVETGVITSKKTALLKDEIIDKITALVQANS